MEGKRKMLGCASILKRQIKHGATAEIVIINILRKKMSIKLKQVIANTRTNPMSHLVYANRAILKTKRPMAKELGNVSI